MGNREIENAIGTRLVEALDQDLDEAGIDLLEKKVATIRKLAPKDDE